MRSRGLAGEVGPEAEMYVKISHQGSNATPHHNATSQLGEENCIRPCTRSEEPSPRLTGPLSSSSLSSDGAGEAQSIVAFSLKCALQMGKAHNATKEMQPRTRFCSHE